MRNKKNPMKTPSTPLPTWAVLELHNAPRLVGLISEQAITGVPFLRVALHNSAGTVIQTKWIAPAMVRSITEVPREHAIAEAALFEAAEAVRRRSHVAIADVQRATADAFRLAPADLSARARPESIVWPRQIAMFLCREMTECSLKDIGRAFGNRDHGTVLHACHRVCDRMETEIEIRELVNRLRGVIAQAFMRQTNLETSAAKAA